MGGWWNLSFLETDFLFLLRLQYLFSSGCESSINFFSLKYYDSFIFSLDVAYKGGWGVLEVSRSHALNDLQFLDELWGAMRLGFEVDGVPM
jgi:hypothetical protein